MQFKTSRDRGKYFQQHKRNIKRMVGANPNVLLPGNIIYCKYRAEYRKTPKDSIYLVIHKNWRGHIHTFDLDYFPPNEMKDVMKLTKDFGRRLEKFAKQNVTWLDFGVEGKALYNKVKLTFEDCYRMLSPKPPNMGSIYLIEYNFGWPEEFKTVQDPKKAKQEPKTT